MPGTALGVDLFSQDFEGVTLGPIVTLSGDQAAFAQSLVGHVSAGWAVDNTAMPGVGDRNPTVGVTEFEGWTFVDKSWWVANEDQGRGEFLQRTRKNCRRRHR